MLFIVSFIVLIVVLWLSSIYYIRSSSLNSSASETPKHRFTWKISDNVSLHDLKVALKKYPIDTLWILVHDSIEDDYVVRLITIAKVPVTLRKLIAVLSDINSLDSVLISSTRTSPSDIYASIKHSKKIVKFVKINGEGIVYDSSPVIHAWNTENSPELPLFLRYLVPFYYSGLLPFVPFKDAGIILRETQVSVTKHEILIRYLSNRMITLLWVNRNVPRVKLEKLKAVGYHGVVIESERDIMEVNKWIGPVEKKKDASPNATRTQAIPR
ncbi:hypothetical protein HK098_004773 [Nowakowskiella sp. JEL0407]|nr:hypothetical protein HK098_004773 [Nowakowskiella sp. JEL0407]